MRRILTELERQSMRAALWDDVKRLPAPRHVRLLYLEQLYLDWWERWHQAELEEAHDNVEQPPHLPVP